MQRLTLEQQQRLLCARFAKAKPWYSTILGDRHLCFDLQLQPTESSAKYTVFFAYSLGTSPGVFVADPKPVTEAHGVRTPHLNFDGSLCLFDPAKREWTGADALVHTTVPWTIRWLFHYEHWLVFGEWRGDPPVALPPVSDAAVPPREEAA